MEENVPPPINATPPAQPPLAPLAPPPLIKSPASGQPPRRGRGWMVLALVLLVLLALSVLYNIGNFAGNLFRGRGVKYARTVGPRLEEVLYEDNDSGNKIALIEVNGIIS